jgi:hypothetical protein
MQATHLCLNVNALSWNQPDVYVLDMDALRLAEALVAQVVKSALAISAASIRHIECDWSAGVWTMLDDITTDYEVFQADCPLEAGWVTEYKGDLDGRAIRVTNSGYVEIRCHENGLDYWTDPLRFDIVNHTVLVGAQVCDLQTGEVRDVCPVCAQSGASKAICLNCGTQ